MRLFLTIASAAFLMSCGPASDTPRRDTTDPLFIGERIYQMRCRTCHQADGSGALKGRRWAADFTDPNGVLNRANQELALSIRAGKEGAYTRMPAFGPILSDAQVDAVLTYIRTKYGVPEPSPIPSE